jgi:hypothetical protein
MEREGKNIRVVKGWGKKKEIEKERKRERKVMETDVG